MENHGTTFDAIKDFLSELWGVFGSPTQKTPLALYNRLISKVEFEHLNQGVDKYISGFKIFFTNFEKSLETSKEFLNIPRETVIRYGDSNKVYIEIQKYIYKSTKEQKEVIRQHLLTIAATIDPSEKKLSALNSNAAILEKMGRGGSAESRQIQNVMDKAKKAMSKVETDDPTEAIAALFSSGVITDMMKDFQGGMENGTLIPEKLMSSLQESLTGVMGGVQDGEGEGINFDKIVLETQKSMAGFNFTNPQKEKVVEEIQEVDTTNVIEDIGDVD